MRYVIIRDDDTNALTPPECLERLYRPFLDHGLPVNLAMIPNVRTNVSMPDGRPEGFLVAKNGKPMPQNLPIGENQKLVQYLFGNPGYQILQHGWQHDYFEFDNKTRDEAACLLDDGSKLLEDAGFPKPLTFVAPHDKFSRASYVETARRFPVISTGWFELRRLPRSWWPGYLRKKISGKPHWRVRKTALLSHPGCLLSCNHPLDTMLDKLIRRVESQILTVAVTHWWEYFPNNQPNEKFIAVLHEFADYLANNSQIKVITFNDIARSNVPLN